MKKVTIMSITVLIIAALYASTLSPVQAAQVVNDSPVQTTSETLTLAAAKANPAVVTIYIAKERPVVHVTYEHPFADDPLFKDIDIAVPVYTPTGTTELQTVGAGSGFIVSHSGYVVTNKHVVSDKDARYTAVLSDGTEKPVSVVYRDPNHDVAIVKIDGTYPTVATIGNSETLKPNQPVAAIGNAYGTAANTVSVGTVSGFDRHIVARGPGMIEELTGLIQTSAVIAPGYSGGPLIDKNGSVVGINVAKDTARNASFSIPINDVKPIIAKYQ